MGVLDELQDRLAGGVTETVVETPLPKEKGLLQKLMERMEAGYIAETLENLSMSPEKIMMPDLKKPMPETNLPITYTPRPPVGGVAQDPSDLDVFQRNEIARQLEAQQKRAIGPPAELMGPRPPFSDPRVMDPTIGGGAGEVVLDTLAESVDFVRRQFTKENPLLAPAIEEFERGGIPALLHAVPSAVTGGVAGLGGFIAGTAVWLSSTASYVARGKGVLDAVDLAREDFDKVTEFFMKNGTIGQPPEIANAMITTAASPFMMISEGLQAGAEVFTDDPRVHSAVQLLGNIAMLGGGKAVVKHVRLVRDRRAALDIRGLGRAAKDALPKEAAKMVDEAVGVIEKSLAGKPTVVDKAEVARAYIVKKMTDAELIRRHLEKRTPGGYGTSPEADAKWLPALEAELKARGLKGIETGKEYVAKKYTPQEIDEIWGRATPEQTAKAAEVLESESGVGISQGEPFRFKNGYVLRLDERGRPITDRPAEPMGRDTLDAINRGKVPMPEVTSGGSPILAATRGGAGAIVDRGKSPQQRVDILKALFPHLDPIKTRNGYIRVKYPDHPFADEYGYVPYHRLVWEQWNGKVAAPWEVVHHKNLNVSDNSPLNLEIKPTRQAHSAEHAGRTPTELESVYPFEMDRSGRLVSRAQNAPVLDEATKLAGLGEKFDDIVIPERVKRGRAPEPVKPTWEKPVLEPRRAIVPDVMGKGAESEFMIHEVQEPFGMRMADPTDIPGPGEILVETRGKKETIVKRGEGVTQRMIYETRPPKANEPPAGVRDYPKDIIIHEDFKAREQLTVEDTISLYEASGKKGSTVNPYEGDMSGQNLWAVSLYPERTVRIPGREIDPKVLYDFYRDNADLLSADPRLNVGTWFNEKKGRVEIDVSVALPEAEATTLAQKYNQAAIMRLSDFQEKQIGGTGTKPAGVDWPAEARRMDEVGATGEMLDIYHYGHAPDVTPQAMGRGDMGAEAAQFAPGYRGGEMLTFGNRLKSNFYTKASKALESHRWGGKTLGKGTVDKGQLLDASKAETPYLDREAVLAGKRGWYDPATGQVRLLTPTQVERLGVADFTGARPGSITGKNIEKFIREENPNVTAQPGEPVESYGKSKFFGKPRGSIDIPSGKEIGDAISRMNFLTFDKFAPVHRVFNLLSDAGVTVDVMNNPSYLVKLLGGVVGKAEAKIMYKRFTIDSAGKVKFGGKSLRDIYSPHHGDMAGFDDFLLARRVREVNRNNAKRPADERVDLSGYNMTDIDATYQAGVKKYGGSAKEFTDFFHSLLDELAESGLVERAVTDKWKAESPEYAPLRVDMEKIADTLDRVSGTGSARKTLDRVINPVRRLRGSKEEKLPPTQAAVLMTYEITSAVERNRAARAIVDMRDLPGGEEFIKEVPPPVQMVKPLGSDQKVPIRGKQEPNVVSVMMDGKRRYFEVDPDLADSMKMLYETGLANWVKVLSIPSRTLRTGATSAPEFMFRNPLRDWLNAYQNAKYGFNPLTDFARGLFNLVKKPESYWKWKATGGEWAMLASMDRALGHATIRQMKADEMTGVKSLRKYIKSPLGYLEKLSETGEKPTRIGVFEKARKKGASDIEAAVESREASTDFAVRGAKTMALSALYTFLNARAQTTLKLARTAKEHPVKFTVKGLAAAGIPSIVLYAINRNDPDYWKRDQFERDMFWFLPIEIGGRQVKIPKGELGVVFGTGVEKVLTALDQHPDGRARVDEFLKEVLQSASPVGNAGEILPTFARPVAEWINNKSYYYGTPIESEEERSLAPYLRYDPKTSETTKTLGKALGVFNKGEGVSPKMIENVVRGYTGGLGRHTIKGIDWAADLLGIQPKAERPSDPMNVPGLAGFVSRRASGFESEPAKSFYEMADRLEMTEQTLKELIRQGPDRAQEIKQWMDSHKTELELLSKLKTTDKDTGREVSLVTKTRSELANLRKMQNSIAESLDLSAEKKRKALDAIDRQVSALVDPLWRLLNAVSSRGKG